MSLQFVKPYAITFWLFELDTLDVYGVEAYPMYLLVEAADSSWRPHQSEGPVLEVLAASEADVEVPSTGQQSAVDVEAGAGPVTTPRSMVAEAEAAAASIRRRPSKWNGCRWVPRPTSPWNPEMEEDDVGKLPVGSEVDLSVQLRSTVQF